MGRRLKHITDGNEARLKPLELETLGLKWWLAASSGGGLVFGGRLIAGGEAAPEDTGRHQRYQRFVWSPGGRSGPGSAEVGGAEGASNSGGRPEHVYLRTLYALGKGFLVCKPMNITRKLLVFSGYEA